MDATTVSSITDAVDFGAVVTGLGVVFASVAVVLIAMKGGKMLLAALR